MHSRYTDIGKYRRDCRLGKGEFGAVYRVYDRALQAQRALKVIKANNPKRLVKQLREARILEVCRHKHVVEVKDADVRDVDDEKCVIIVTELLEMGSAQELLKSGFVTLSKSLKIVREALFGLEHLHNNEVIHCDVKPGNILLTKNLTAKLSDFGLAIRIALGEIPSHIYTLHQAPEATPSNPGSMLGDIYAMGVTLYRLVNNIKDFEALAPRDIQREVKKGKFPDRRGYQMYVPGVIKEIANKAMRVDPRRRFQSATRFRESLERVRINIDWLMLNRCKWVGKRGSDRFQVEANEKKSGWIVDFYKNGRRKRQLCQIGLKNTSHAESEVSKLVLDTSVS